MKSTKEISSDLQIPGFPEVVHLKQYDANTRYIKIPVTDGGSSFTLPDNPVFMVGARLPDGSKVLYDKIINASAPIGVLVSVDPVKWTAQGITGATFTKTASGWSKDGSDINLDDFGVSITKGTPTIGANIVVSSENAVNVLSGEIEIGLAPSLSMIAGTGQIELYIGTNDELISLYCKELQIHEAAADPYSAFTPQSVCTIIAQIQAFVNAELTAHPEWTTTLADGAVTMQKLGADVIEELDNKADIDGSYESMTVGNAEQLVSSVGIADETPYNFRTSGGSTEIGDREELNAVVGVSVPWNQLVEPETKTETKTDVTYTQNGDGSISVSGTAASTRYIDLQSLIISGSGGSAKRIQNHKYAVLGGMSNALFIRAVKSPPSVTLFDAKADGIYSVSGIDGTETYSVFRLVVPTGATVSTTVYPQIFDLTLLFGSTIADYIYALEQSNAGSGVAYFRKLFPKPFYAYNSSELLSVQTNLHRMVGFNQWDEEYLLGYYKNDGVFSPSTSGYFSSKNKIPVIPSTSYHIKVDVTTSVYICYYDGNGTFVERVILGSNPKTQRNFTTPSYCCFINFSTGTGYGTTYNHNICINLSWDGERNGEYEPYEAHEYALDDITLRGILKLDANNNLYADGDRYLPDGTVERRYGIVDLGTLEWTKPTATDDMNFRSDGIKTVVKFPPSTNNGYKGIICSLYSSTPVSSLTDKYIYITTDGQIRVKDTANASLTATQFRTLMSGVYLVYELATPTTETADPYTQTQIVDDFGTEEFVDAAVESGERDVAVPVGNETVYKPNLRAKLEMAPDSPDGDGDYIVRQTNGQSSYIPLVEVKELPDMPSEDGFYKLRCTVSNGTATLSWVSEDKSEV